MKPLRLLMTADAIGGVWQYATDLAGALAPLGVDTVIALLGPAPSADQRRAADAMPGVTLVETGLPVDWLCEDAAPVRAAGAAIADLAREHAVDLIQYNMPTLAAAPAGLPTIAVTHGCVSTWWAAAKRSQLDQAYLWHRSLMLEGLRAVDRVVAPTRAYGESVAALYGLPLAPVAVHNGRNAPAEIKPGPLSDQAITVGRMWDSVKNAALLDRVAARLAVPFYAAGALVGPHNERVTLNHLQTLGEIDGDAVRQRLAGRPVFVSAASFEPFGLAVLEAAQAGCALVLSDIATFRELWDGAAVFVSGDDAQTWASAVEALIADPVRRHTLGEAARVRAARYTPAAVARAMATHYRALLSGDVTRVAA
jgi:glycosyltransferase involved in cell wall biosynthesis